MLSKADIRAQHAARRRERGPEDAASRSAELCAHVLAEPRWRAATSVAAFVGVKGEPDTRPLLIAALAAGKQLWLPRMGGPRRQNLEFVAVADLVTLAPAPFGLLEPQGGTGVALAETDVDLVLMPGLAFTRTGVRLGYGKGHYDGAMAPLRDHPRPVRMGLCFSDELVEALPEEPHDVGVHALATDLGLIDCTCLQ
ncbi:5-formyltetrahydrofolate cyclo-ligase [Nannocystis exedens]|uniref:5-formyltetrahydrofolate cyclo-ligase n=1 Tax=Nannocystis exedens TaxID=54 RepID=A0A1I1V2I2_9BACT|nr:5-formyltetrahydrofolate cyclo-ligase [Nannocystis exedens]PCC72301.1 5-formyltetrahydrofolate cyclo-ligase [Nannocystis exedens]SFD77251.1 5-formyltetrahydrofolate cyclo-ligase [Nannocystis exedens]